MAGRERQIKKKHTWDDRIRSDYKRPFIVFLFVVVVVYLRIGGLNDAKET